MAAPDGTDILDVTGRWMLNRELSDSLEETFELVGHQNRIIITLWFKVTVYGLLVLMHAVIIARHPLDHPQSHQCCQPRIVLPARSP